MRTLLSSAEKEAEIQSVEQTCSTRRPQATRHIPSEIPKVPQPDSSTSSRPRRAVQYQSLLRLTPLYDVLPAAVDAELGCDEHAAVTVEYVYQVSYQVARGCPYSIQEKTGLPPTNRGTGT